MLVVVLSVSLDTHVYVEPNIQSALYLHIPTTRTPGKLPFTRILTGLPFGAHTLTVLATAADGTNMSTTTRFNTSGS